ncbi:hypothetical protein RFI_27670 [Reticulomyxa filosa]|uniref:Amino acid transporter transmembrane domain-containing protein n=1 Tax=Reticulomyxa filosa TaxID=46433 RepID=X6M6U4_RETFI|nr:hypothetical protein RFI_27670 [Reticulomyxa filosa]|eukprot:ETO09713.1 hypothetical protein RFI_27670 [Reticulomyxa filosa]
MFQFFFFFFYKKKFKGAVLFFQSKVKEGSIKGSIFNMILSTVGGGMLSLAFGVRQVGLIPGLILLTLSCWLSYFTNDLLLITCEYMPYDPTPVDDENTVNDENTAHRKRRPTYWNFSLACSPSWGRHLANFTQVLLLVQNFGSFISYEVAFGGLLDLVWKVVIDDKTDIYAWVVLVITWVIIFPLSLLNSMSALQFTSLLGITCSIYLGCVIFGEYFHLCDQPTGDPSIRTCIWRKDFHLDSTVLFKFDSAWQFTQGFLICFPLFAFAYTAQQYMLPIYFELTNQSRKRMLKVLQRSSYIILFIYICAAGFGYLTFLDGVCGNILLNNYHKDWAVVIAAITISISMIFAQPITTYAWRMNFAEIIYNKKTLERKKHVIITILFTFVTMALSLLLTDIEIVFGLLGATTFPAIGFVLPAIFFVSIVPADKFPHRRRFAIVQAVFVTIASLASLVYQVYTMIYPTNDSCDSRQQIETPNLFG